MKRMYPSLLLAAGSVFFLFLIIFSPAGVDATEHQVKSGTRIQDVISSPTFTSGDTIVVEPGTYAGPIALPNNITIRGTETARTILTGNGGPVMTVNGNANAAAGLIGTGTVNIQYFTFINASTGVSLSNNTASNTGITITITNNVFQVGPGGTAISEQFSTLTTVARNTFYQNGIALACDADINISNNIFAGNSIAIYDTYPAAPTKITNNAFFGNNNTGPMGASNLFTGDPSSALFAKTASVDLVLDPRDFHLQENSPCINAGNNASTQNDIGAYGGASADTIPFPVSGLQITSTTTSTTDSSASVNLAWLPNLSYLVTNTSTTAAGGYYLYVGSAPRTYDCSMVSCGTDSRIRVDNVGSAPIYTLNGLTTSTTNPSAPVNFQSSPRDSMLVLTWSAVSGATGYKVRYGKLSLEENEPIDVGTNTTYNLTGLINGTYYYVAVSAYVQQKYYFTVTAFNNTSVPFQESAYSNETSTQVGPSQESGLSTVIYDFPEPVTTYPALPDMGGGCFIATAAYGCYTAPEVQALRDFRDRYLLTSVAGRLFVQWYYRHGPAAAAVLNDHPGYKPLVRTALMPVVGAAIFMTRTSMVCKAVVFLLPGAAIAFICLRKRLSRMGGLH